jgi:hypothetical protein
MRAGSRDARIQPKLSEIPYDELMSPGRPRCSDSPAPHPILLCLPADRKNARPEGLSCLAGPRHRHAGPRPACMLAMVSCACCA